MRGSVPSEMFFEYPTAYSAVRYSKNAGPPALGTDTAERA